MSTQHMLLWIFNKHINNCQLEKNALFGAMPFNDVLNCGK